MSFRSLAGVLFICSAIVAPWAASDWLPTRRDIKKVEPSVSVPGLGNQNRERRAFSSIPKGPGSKTNRKISNGIARSIATGARATLRNPRVPESKISVSSAARHNGRIENEMNRLGLRLGSPVYCRIFKEERELELWIQRPSHKEFSLFKVYRICSLSGLPGPKLSAGDQQAPEGFYYVTSSRMLAKTEYHLGFDLGYPNLVDRFHGRTGDNVKVQGNGVSHGSFALSDQAIEEVFAVASAALNNGQPYFRVHSFPFRMEDKIMDSKISQFPANDQFWANLKEGYDFFEILRFPPNVTMSESGNYQFKAK